MSSDGNIIINENHVLHAVGTFATATIFVIRPVTLLIHNQLGCQISI